MTSNFEDFKSDRERAEIQDDSLELDIFELLSAYIDGELTPPERDRVQYLLDRDPKIKHTYRQLLNLQGHIKHLSAPPSSVSVDELSTAVFQKIDRHQRRRSSLVWGGAAVAAAAIAAISGILPGANSPVFRMAKSSQTNFEAPTMVAVAIHKPAVKIPKAAVTQPATSNTNKL